ncbi:alpha-mannosidase [Halobacillus andaensis]|uniref:Alpha-mannosidase n=1 Tax=Halobacillus andaensis TaxID=1176239 RepID=A0A917EZT7_HALAA|nr:glycoside hydrolase family 38 C-terminal domain-containing protein [Halobacillus andaensis]MBP2005309.1 alpha-mannosidase [Halobacillus andaensis]GGF30508.1 alpha-mannosidase [Halobacillus andaensis]
MSKKRVYVVPHSHWDREWYFTIEDSNLLLAENLDHLLTILEKNPDYHGYIFDAQISIVDEYLKVRPKNTERLRSLITEKRLFVGPWYTQADSLLVHKESLIRNLLYGVKGAKEMGHAMNIGYLPDIFGQNQYLPSIFKGFGIDNAILQRGIYQDQLDRNTNFLWQSPDGKQVKANVIPLGYGPGKFLRSDDEFHYERLQPMLEKLENINHDTNHLLLPSGGDQVLVRDHFPATIQQLNEKDERYEFVLSDYETFMNDTWETHSFKNVIEGELIGTEGSRIHNTIGSQRYDIKKLNDEVEHKIIHQLEPLASLALHVGLRYPKEWLDLMWKQLFDVHAHDSIGGCNSDETNHDIIQRLIKVNRQADGLMNLIKKQMTEAIRNEEKHDDLVVTFNTDPKPYQGGIQTVLFTKSPQFGIHTIDGEKLKFSITQQDYLSGGKKIVVTAEGDQEVEIPGYYRSEVYIPHTELPALGYTTWKVVEEEAISDHLSETQMQSIGNRHYSVEWKEGRLTLNERASNTTIEDFIQFEDTADAGDSYDYSPLPNDAPIISGKAELLSVEHSDAVHRLTVRHEMQLPQDLSARKQGISGEPFSINTVIELRKGEGFVRMKHVVDNHVNDHRLRVIVKTPVGGPNFSYGDQGYSLIRRPVVSERMADWREQGYKEAPVPIYKVEQFAGLLSERGSLMAFTKGIKEYEIVDSSIALTMFRSVGLLGRDDLMWRPGRASGINNKVVTTPDAQMHGEMTFEYALQLSGSELRAEELFDSAARYKERYVTYQRQELNTFEERLDRFEIPYPVKKLPSQYSLTELYDDGLFVSSVKKAHDSKDLIIRVFNPADVKRAIDIKGRTDVEAVNLNEDPEGDLFVEAKSFQTIRLRNGGAK